MSKLKMQKQPWYEKGLNFKCTECGQCCTGSPGYIWVSDEEITAIANHLDIPRKEFQMKYLKYKDGRYSLVEKEHYDCIFLKENRCTIYEHRPTQCKTFPWWPSNLESPENWKNAAKSCEGINKDASLVSLEEIQRQGLGISQG